MMRRTIAAMGLLALGLPAQAQSRQLGPPPPDFPIESASPQDLRALGLPPDISPKLLKVLRDPRLHLPPPPPPDGMPPIRGRPHISAGQIAGQQATSFNWSGQVKVGPIASDSGTLEAEMIVPANTTHDGNVDYVFFWVGFDGWIDSSNVLQGGVLCSSLGACTAVHESFPDNLINDYVVHDGHDILIEVWHTSTAPHGHVIVSDMTNGGFSNVAFDCQSCGGIDRWTGTSKQWVVERPATGGAPATLTNYHAAVMISSSYLPLGGGPGSTSSANINIQMLQAGATVSSCTAPDLHTEICEAYR